MHRYALMEQAQNFFSLYVLEKTGDLSVKGYRSRCLIMNIDDLICVGATTDIMLSSTIGRNKSLIPAEVLSAIINGTRID